MKEPVYLDADAASKYLNSIGVPISVGGLGNMRWLKRGPKYTKVAGKVRYRQDWLDEFVLACTVAPSPPPRRLSVRSRA